jgi:glycosyltransferase involved in cell wall biosynthesis
MKEKAVRPVIDVSVVVPFCNAERWIEACIEGLVSQKYPRSRCEILMVDNNSTDASAAIVRRYPEVRLLAEVKQGSYAARNRGLGAARGDLVAFTDADCAPSHDWLDEVVRAMEDPDIAILLGSREYVGPSFGLSMIAAYENERDAFMVRSERRQLYYGHTNNMVVRRAVFDELGPFVESRRGADTIFVRRCVDRYSCDAVRFSDRVQVRHLEIDRMAKLFHKYLVYGASHRGYGHVVEVRPLTYRDRIGLLRKVMRDRRYSWPNTFVSVGGLATCYVCWIAGKAGLASSMVDGQSPAATH